MTIQGLMKLTLLDYPGHVACTVFFGGCNFRCPFCHNAGLVLTPSDGENIDEDTFFSFLNRRRGIFDGVCITGGEPLLRDLTPFIEKIRALGFRVKLDTNGAFPDRLEKLLDARLVDYVAMDIKNSPARYDETSGTHVDLDAIRKSIALIMEKAPDYEFRTTLVDGFHTPESIGEAAEMIRGAKQYFLQGFIDSGALIGKGMCACSPEATQDMLHAAQVVVPNTQLRGI